MIARLLPALGLRRPAAPRGSILPLDPAEEAILNQLRARRAAHKARPQ